MVWKQFLVAVAEEAESEGDKFWEMFSSMTWGFQKKAQLSLTNSNGYDTMLQQLWVSKELGVAIMKRMIPFMGGRCVISIHTAGKIA